MTNLRGSSHALLFGVSGQTQGRLAIEADGSMCYGDGNGSFDTTLHRPRSAVVKWDPPAVKPGTAAGHVVVLVGAKSGDIATVSHTAVDATHLVLLSATAQADSVAVVLFNAGAASVDLPPGELRVAIADFS